MEIQVAMYTRTIDNIFFIIWNFGLKKHAVSSHAARDEF
jgi:hypothetical protein